VAAAVERGDTATGSVPHVVASAVEHPAVLEYLVAQQAAGKLTYTLAPVQPDGTVAVDDVLGCIKPGSTCLVTVMHSNNETGALQPIQELGARIAGGKAPAAAPAVGCWWPCASRRLKRMSAVRAALADGRVLFHTDAAQSCGKVPVDVRALGCDYLTIVGHKFGGPKGVAALYVRKGAPLRRYLYGGGQEHGFRAGTENVLHMVGLGAAADLAKGEMPQLMAHVASLRDRLQAALLASKPLAEAGIQLRVHGPGDDARRLPNTLSIALRGVCAAKFLPSVGDSLAASAGAACHTHDPSAPVVISGVLRAMGVPLVWAMGTLRLSVGRHTTQEDVDAAVRIISTQAPKFKEA
jgi:cysteine desulfurase